MSHPSRQPTCEVAHPRVATMQQVLHGLQATASCCASHDQIAVARQLGVAPLQFTERYVNELRYVMGRAGDLMRFAHIEQPAFPITERPVGFCSVNLKIQCIHGVRSFCLYVGTAGLRGANC